MKYEIYEGNELTQILLWKARLEQIKNEEKEINKIITILVKNMKEKTQNIKITIECKGLRSDELQYIYRFLNEISLDDKRINYHSDNLK